MDERQPVSEYLRESAHTLDGGVWLAICAASLVAGIDLAMGSHWLPLRESHNPGKAAVLLAFSSLLTLLALISARQMPFSSHRVSVYLRGVFLIVFFALLNF